MKLTLTEAHSPERFVCLEPSALNDSLVIREQPVSLLFRTGKIDLQTLSLKPGIHIIRGRISLVRPLRLHLESSGPYVTLPFILSGRSSSAVTPNEPVSFHTNQHNLFYAPTPELYFDIAPEQPYEWLSIHLAPNFFGQMAKQKGDTISRLAASVSRQQVVRLGTQNLPITAAMHTVLTQLTRCSMGGASKRLFLEAKVIELLALQLDQYEHALTEPEPSVVHRPEYDKLLEVRRLLQAHFDKPPTLSELSRLVGLNECKLKKGFREVFGEPVYGWVLNYRLGYAY